MMLDNVMYATSASQRLETLRIAKYNHSKMLLLAQGESVGLREKSTHLCSIYVSQGVLAVMGGVKATDESLSSSSSSSSPSPSSSSHSPSASPSSVPPAAAARATAVGDRRCCSLKRARPARTAAGSTAASARSPGRRGCHVGPRSVHLWGGGLRAWREASGVQWYSPEAPR